MLKKTLTSCLISISLVIMGAIGAQAATIPSPTLQGQVAMDSQTQKRNNDIQSFFDAYNAKKMRLQALQRQFSNSELQFTAKEKQNTEKELNDLQKQVNYIETNFEKLSGLKKVDTPDLGVKTMATNDGSVKFSGTLYNDTLFAHHWYLQGSYNWGSNTAYANQKSGSGDVGGYEGAWVGLNRNVLTYSTSAHIYDSYSGVDQAGVKFYESYSANGRSWRWQDSIAAGAARSYNSHDGIFGLYFEWDPSEPASGSKTQYYTGYAHTWDTTSINSIGVGPYSASVGWASTGHSWEDSSQWVYTH